MIQNDIQAIAFDIDGTLYPSWKLNIRIIPYFIKNLPFFLQFSKVRKILHRTAPLPDFYEYQARLLADFLKISVENAHEKINSIVYNGLSSYFDHFKPFNHIEETFKKCREAGFKVAILSDFPPEQKGEIWGVKKYCDVVLGSEACGALKPSKYTFGALAHSLDLPLEKILYVGNNIKLDIIGAKKVGMKTAYILPFWRKILGL
ncbi:MAG: HAD family hydrolase, partial [Treponemataceae bacterium]